MSNLSKVTQLVVKFRAEFKPILLKCHAFGQYIICIGQYSKKIHLQEKLIYGILNIGLHFYQLLAVRVQSHYNPSNSVNVTTCEPSQYIR